MGRRGAQEPLARRRLDLGRLEAAMVGAHRYGPMHFVGVMRKSRGRELQRDAILVPPQAQDSGASECEPGRHRSSAAEAAPSRKATRSIAQFDCYHADVPFPAGRGTSTAVLSLTRLRSLCSQRRVRARSAVSPWLTHGRQGSAPNRVEASMVVARRLSNPPLFCGENNPRPDWRWTII